MIHKLIILTCSLAVTRAGVIGTHFSPSTSVSSVYSSINNPASIGAPIYEKTATQIHYESPAPVYESVLSTHESKTKGLDGSQQTTFTKSLDTAYSSVKKYDTRVTNNGLTPTIYSSPLYSNAIYSSPSVSYLHNPGAYTISSPLSHSVLANSISPVTYTTHSTAPVVNASPILTKTVSPAITSYGGETIKTTISYSEAPLVSHMTFTGLGTSYNW